MWRARFQHFLREQLVAAGHPGIAGVEIHHIGELPNLKVVGTDGIEISLMITRVAAPDGERYDGEERVVTKSELDGTSGA